MAAGGGNTTRVVLTALTGNAVIAVSKFTAWTFTGSSAMLAEAFHSLADTGNQGLMLLGLSRADKDPDETHPFGYGKDTYFWSFVVAISIFTLGATIALYEGTHKLIEIAAGTVHEVGDQTAGLVVLVVSLVVEGWAFTVAAREYRRDIGDLGLADAIRSNRAAATVTVLFEDAAACTGLVIALIGIGLSAATGNPIFDAIATLLIGVVLLVVAWFLGWMTYHLLIGQSANDQDQAAIREAVIGVADVDDILELITLHMGERYILLNIGVVFRPGLTTLELETAIDDVETAVRAAVPSVQRIFIEADSFRTPRE